MTAAKVNLPAPQDPYGDRVGCVSLCTSRDMKTWTHQKPFFYSRRFSDAAECPDYFRIGDWHYLVYSHWSDGKGTYYAKARTLHGPWLLPPGRYVRRPFASTRRKRQGTTGNGICSRGALRVRGRKRASANRTATGLVTISTPGITPEAW